MDWAFSRAGKFCGVNSTCADTCSFQMKIVYLFSPGVVQTSLTLLLLFTFAILNPNIVSKKQDQFVVSHGPIEISKPPPPQVLIAQPGVEYEIQEPFVVIH